MFLDFRIIILFGVTILLLNSSIQGQIIFLNVEGTVTDEKDLQLSSLDEIKFNQKISLVQKSSCDFIDGKGTPYELEGELFFNIKKNIDKGAKNEKNYIPVDKLDGIKQISSLLSDGPDLYIYEPVTYCSTYISAFDIVPRVEWFFEDWVPDTCVVEITIEDFFGKKLNTYRTDKKHFDIDLKMYQSKSEVLFKVSTGRSTQTVLFVNKTDSNISYSGSLNNLLKGLFLESKGRFDDAKDYYRIASERSEYGSSYQLYYNNFLVRYEKYFLEKP